ncbi:M1 family metallopeptidase [Nocardioides sp.]|uniref:M1 family metallopeptidase n=1 Tax=Nocardioides sp. TaxID=35761 RepID=UPI0035190CD6
MSRRRRTLTTALLAVVLTGSTGLAACGGPDTTGGAGTTGGAAASGAPTGSPTGSVATEVDPALAAARSTPAEDSAYPEVGDPGVDALHYDLDVAWDRDTDTLTATEVLTFRATADAAQVRLDLAGTMAVTEALLDGAPVSTTHDGKDLVVQAAVVADQVAELTLSYAGTPEPVAAPATRTDIEGLGLTIDPDHQLWTMQEPFGAYTWYAVNDHPSDKALYDLTITAPPGWVGVAGGTPVGDTAAADGRRTTSYRLEDPAAAYLVTLAVGDYTSRELTSGSGVPITLWTPRGERRFDDALDTAPAAIDWLEQHLGPYPFDTAGAVVVRSASAMETQSMITLGDTDYATSPAVILHEFAHQWWGDLVTPADWRDLWLNEGMAMYLQWWWEAEQEGVPLDRYLERYAGDEAYARVEAGPPGRPDPRQFGSTNVYYGGAYFWAALRREIGDDAFLAVVRDWPAQQAGRSVRAADLLAFLEERTGRQLDDLWRSWLLARVSPELPR